MYDLKSMSRLELLELSVELEKLRVASLDNPMLKLIWSAHLGGPHYNVEEELVLSSQTIKSIVADFNEPENDDIISRLCS